MFRLSSSLRSAPPEITLERARRAADSLGISRVTDVTRLDRVGVPVCVSVRPNAQSLCVNAGKGFYPIEARVGAYMEAIEFAVAEYGGSPLAVTMATPRDVLDGRRRSDAILDFCPVVGAKIDLDADLGCVEAEEIVSGQRVLVPAQLVFLPYPADVAGERYFVASSNGLSSGNDVLEATVHGIGEVIERDVASFLVFQDNSALVEEDSFPAPARAVAEAARGAGLALFVRHAANPFGLPFFSATVVDPEIPDPIHFYGGSACHPSRDISLVRAVCEAMQSRLSLIHGGRDDLADRYAKFTGWPAERRMAYGEKLLHKISNRERVVRFEDTHDRTLEAGTLAGALHVLVGALRSAGLSKVCRVVYTQPGQELQVVRIIVPGIEHFNEVTPRMGKRLGEHVRATS